MIHDRPEGRPFGAARPGLPPAAALPDLGDPSPDGGVAGAAVVAAAVHGSNLPSELAQQLSRLARGKIKAMRMGMCAYGLGAGTRAAPSACGVENRHKT